MSDERSSMSSPEADPAGASNSSIASPSRRRFGASGLAVSGIIATVSSRSALGATVCKSPSGMLSGNLSSHGEPPRCEGRSPGYWKTHSKAKQWPIPTDTRFGSVFTVSLGSPYANITFLDLLSEKEFDRHNLGMHLVAAYLNALKGWTPYLTRERIKSMFSEWQTRGYFQPTAGVNWTAEQIVHYLQGTQDTNID